MAKLTKEQTAKFNKLYEAAINWGEDCGTCTGLFAELSPQAVNLKNFATEDVGNGYLEILAYKGTYWDLYGKIKIDSKAKGKIKKIVEHLIDKDFDDENFYSLVN